jgi:hypothetical protein
VPFVNDVSFYVYQIQFHGPGEQENNYFDVLLRTTVHNGTLATVHTGVAHDKSIACQADWLLLVSKKEHFSCPIFLNQSNLLPMHCM